MAKYNSLAELFTAIANAIRAKTGGTSPIVAEDFPTAVSGLKPGRDYSYLFNNNTTMTELTANLNTSKGTTFDSMFNKCKSLTSVALFDTSSGTSFNSMFYECDNLKTIPAFNTSKGTDFAYMFYYCGLLESIPQLDVGNGTTFSNMFCYATEITTMPALNTSKGTNFGSMFKYCQELTSIDGLDLDRAEGTYKMTAGCLKLTNLTLYNVRSSLSLTGYENGILYGNLLTVDSLIHTIQELCTATSEQTLTIGSANLAKIAGLYCRIIDDTVEKKTMELCESTDEGAMTLAEYAAEKGWALA